MVLSLNSERVLCQSLVKILFLAQESELARATDFKVTTVNAELNDDFLVYSRRQRNTETPVEYDV